MKRCSRCQSTYADFVEFCFEDGEVLVLDKAGGSPRPSATLEAMDPAEAPPLPPRPQARPPVPPVRRDFPVRGAAEGEAFEAPVARSVAVSIEVTPPNEDLTTEVQEVGPPPSSDPAVESVEQDFWAEESDPPVAMTRTSRKPLLLGLAGFGAMGCGIVVWALVGGEAPQKAPPAEAASQTAVAIAEVPPQVLEGADQPDVLKDEPVIEMPQGDGEEEPVPEVESAGDQTTDDERNALTPAPAAKPRPAPAAKPRPAPAAKPRPAPAAKPRPAPVARPRPAVEASIGSVTIESDPEGSAVFIDGEAKGVTPLTVDLAYGAHVLELRRSGRAPYSGKINVDKPTMSIPRVTLPSSLFGDVPSEDGENPPAEVEVVSWVNLTVVWVGHDGHTLQIDGAEQGTLPVSVRVQTGVHVFEVVAPDGTSESERREIEDGQGGVLTFGI